MAVKNLYFLDDLKIHKLCSSVQRKHSVQSHFSKAMVTLMSSVLSASLLVSLSLVAQVLLPQVARLPSQQASKTMSFLQILGDSLLPTG